MQEAMQVLNAGRDWQTEAVQSSSCNGVRPSVKNLRSMPETHMAASVSRNAFDSKLMLSGSLPLQGLRDGRSNHADGRKPFRPSQLTGRSSFLVHPTFSEPPAFLPSSNPPSKDAVHGMRPYTENFSDAMVIKCDEFNLKFKTESDEENRLSSYNSSIRLELVRDAFAENKALQQELSEHWGAQNQIKRQQRLLAEHERRQQSASMRDTQLRTRAEEYSKQSERRRDDLLQKIAKKKKLRSDQFDKQYMLLKDEFQNFVQGKVDKEIAMREAKKQQRVRDLHATYKLEVTRKMHSQVMSVIHDLPSDEITLRRRKMFDKVFPFPPPPPPPFSSPSPPPPSPRPLLDTDFA